MPRLPHPLRHLTWLLTPLILVYCCTDLWSQDDPVDSYYSLSFSNAAGVVEDFATVDLELKIDDAGGAVTAYRFIVCLGDELVDITEDDIVKGRGVLDREFDSYSLEFQDGVSWSIAAKLAEGHELAPGNAYALCEATYELLAEGTSVVEICDDLGGASLVIKDAKEVVPVTNAGKIEIAPSPLFLRGDANGDGLFQPLRDARFVLAYLFVGGATPPCMDAADANDDGSVDIGDSVTILNAYRDELSGSDGGFGLECLADAPGDDLRCDSPPSPCPADPPNPGQDLRVLLDISEVDGPVGAGDTATVTISMTIEGDAIQAYSFGVCHDAEVQLVNESSGIDPIVAGADLPVDELAFHFVRAGDDGWVAAALFSPSSLMAELGEGEHELYEATYRVVERLHATIEFCETLGDPPVEVQVLSGDFLFQPDMKPGCINCGISEPEPRFKRGDVNGDGVVSALADAIFLLRYVHEDGPDPPCLDAADVNDSGKVSSLEDALYLLKWQYGGTGIALPKPGPYKCGVDPTPDVDGNDIGCESVARVCQ